MDKPNSYDLSKIMESRKTYRYMQGETVLHVTDGSEKYHLGVASPILCQGDLMGCVMLLLGEGDNPLQEADQGLARAAAGFLGRQMES
jgi:AbrB family transcriptional regulator (stage V sporulation protein T)